jgi:membrane associated rhomboid family serine protease
MDFFDSEQECKYWIRVFKTLDKDKDGLVHTFPEFEEYLRSKHASITEDELRSMTEGHLVLDSYRFLRVLHRIYASDRILWQMLKKPENHSVVRIGKEALAWFGIRSEQSPAIYRNNSVFRRKEIDVVPDEEEEGGISIFFPEGGYEISKEERHNSNSTRPLCLSMPIKDLDSNLAIEYPCESSQYTGSSPSPYEILQTKQMVTTLKSGVEGISTESEMMYKKTPQTSPNRKIDTSTTENKRGGTTNTASKLKLFINPELLAQLHRSTLYRPYFIVLVTVIDVALMIYALIYNHGFEPMYVNPMAGVSAVTLVRLGAKYVPCMRPGIFTEMDTSSQNLEQLCGMSGFTNGVPNQWYRFITAIFLHSGLFHLAFNLVFQLTTGCMIERKFGCVRIAIIYLSSGIVGNLFGSLMQPRVASVGASGALYGLLGVLYLDLFQNWPLLIHPWRNFFILTTTILVSLGIGLLPYIDNYAHVGGIACGIVSGIIFCPTIVFGKWDARRKLISLMIATPLFVAMFVAGFLYFYVFYTDQFCNWCRWFNCIPPDSKWCKTFKP